MLVNFFNSHELENSFNISFSYRHSREYSFGFNRLVKPSFPVYELKLVPPDWAEQKFGAWPRGIRRLMRSTMGLSTKIPLFLINFILLLKLFVSIKPDIIHINNGGYPAAWSCRIAALAANVLGIKTVVMVVNNLAKPYSSLNRLLDYPLDRLVIRSVKKFVTGSRSAAERLGHVLGLDSDTILAIPNGVNLRPFTEDEQETRNRLGLADFEGMLFGVIAILERRKGHRVLLEVVDQIRSLDHYRQQEFLCLFIGEGSEHEALEDYVKKSGLESSVRILGHENNVQDVIRLIDVLILPSIEDEDFPFATLEAMALGKAVIASELAGTPEQIVPNVTGLLVPPGDPDSLCSAILKVLENRELCDQWGKNGQKLFYKKFTAEIAVRNYLSLYMRFTTTFD